MGAHKSPEMGSVQSIETEDRDKKDGLEGSGFWVILLFVHVSVLGEGGPRWPLPVETGDRRLKVAAEGEGEGRRAMCLVDKGGKKNHL